MSTARIDRQACLRYRQCPKLFWHAVNQPAGLVLPPRRADREAARDERRIRELLRGFLGPGAAVEAADADAAAAETAAVLSRAEFGRPVFDARLCHGDLTCRLDALLPLEDGEFDLYTLSAASAEDPACPADIAFQAHVARACGVRLRRCLILSLNGHYVRRGALDPRGLFTARDATGAIGGAYAAMGETLAGARRTAALPEPPDVAIGAQCPGCPLEASADGCWAGVRALPDSVFTLHRMQLGRAAAWWQQGVRRIGDLPADAKLGDKQHIQVAAARSGAPHVDARRLAAFLERLAAPVAYLDFETFAAPVPEVDGRRSRETLPFQFSLRVVDGPAGGGGAARHASWLWDGDPAGDPQAAMLTALRAALGGEGSIVAFNAGFEQEVLRAAAGACPEHREWVRGLNARFVDLLQPFRDFWLYHPAERGRCGLKTVLPAWTGRGYEGLAIAEGETASLEYRRVTFDPGGAADRERVRRDLEAYCGLDTQAMVDLVGVLRRLTAG